MKAVRRRLRPGFLASFALIFCSIGCHDILGPEQMPVATVDGKVSQRGAPITRGWIEFVPVDGTVGRMRSAPLRGDGTFHAIKVPVGRNLIRLVNVDYDPKVLGPVAHELRRVFGAFTSPIRRTIALDRNPRLDVDIAEEYVKLTRQPGRPGPEGPPRDGAPP
jgi:hypothetical protein